MNNKKQKNTDHHDMQHDNMQHDNMKNDGMKHHDMKHDMNEHHKMMIKDYKRRFFISLGFTIPILVLSPTINQWLHIDLSFPGRNYILAGLATIIFFYGGWPFLKGLYKELKSKSPGMMTLIAVAITVAYGYSVAVIFGLEGKTFFWELATLIIIMLLGHWLEMRSILGASRALEELVKLLPSEAHVLRNGEFVDIKLEKLQNGDTVLIKPGEKIPADGTVTKGESSINESMITGESAPVLKEEGEKVIGGTVNGKGSLELKIEGTGEESYISKVIKLVKETQESKSRGQRIADKAAFWLTIIALSIGFITLAVWLIAGQGFAFALERMASVMVITCPHALGLAIPLVVAISTALSAKNGLLIRNRVAFESSRKITTVVFDKTGTLTEGIFGVSNIISFTNKYEERDMIEFAVAVEKQPEHPIAEGIVRKAKEMSIKVEDAEEFQSITGKGVEGKYKNKNIKVVSLGFLKENSIKLPDDYKVDQAETNVFVLVDNELSGVLLLSDIIREESETAVKALKEEGIKCWMLTGDNELVAKKVSEKLNLDGYYAEILPHEKQEKIKELQEKGEFVAMTGDGINDAPALAQADVGIAIGSGTDVAAETADIILVNSNPMDVKTLILFGKKTYKKFVQNLIWATGYNLVAIPLAAGIFFPLGFVLNPAIGAILMSLSTVIVAINAKLLKIDKKDNEKENN